MTRAMAEVSSVCRWSAVCRAIRPRTTTPSASSTLRTRWASSGLKRPSSAAAASARFPSCSSWRARLASSNCSARPWRPCWAERIPSVTAASASPKRSMTARIPQRKARACHCRGSSPTSAPLRRAASARASAVSKWPRVYWNADSATSRVKRAALSRVCSTACSASSSSCCAWPGAAGDHEVVEQQGKQACPQVRRQPGEVEGPAARLRAHLGGDREQAGDAEADLGLLPGRQRLAQRTVGEGLCLLASGGGVQEDGGAGHQGAAQRVTPRW